MQINSFTFTFGSAPANYPFGGNTIIDSILKRVTISSIVYNSTSMNKDYDHSPANATFGITGNSFADGDVLTINFVSPIEF